MIQNTKSSPLTLPIKLPCGVTIPNRLVKSATSELLADSENNATSKHAELYRKWAGSGVGLLITGNVQIDYRHLEHPGNVVIGRKQNAQQIDSLSNWSKAAKSQGALIFMQLSHAGRQTNRIINSHPYAPSNIALNIPGVNFGEPLELNSEQIEELKQRFGYAAEIAQRTGFDGIQLHAAHGYLLSQFLSAKVNVRTDTWGGDLRSRSKFLLESISIIREKAGPAFPISVKLNSSDFQRGGFTFEDCLQLCVWLDEMSVDLIEISGGTYEQPKAAGVKGFEQVYDPFIAERNIQRESFFSKFVPEIQKRVKNAKIMVTGGFLTIGGMLDALEHDQADLIGVARPLCINPNAINQLLAEEIDSFAIPAGKLRLGPGILSAQSSIKLVRALNAAGSSAWYTEQLEKMGNGLEPQYTLPFIKALWKMFQKEKKMAASLKSNEDT